MHALFAMVDNQLSLEQPELALAYLDDLLELKEQLQDLPSFYMTVLMRIGLAHLQKKDNATADYYLTLAEKRLSGKMERCPFQSLSHLFPQSNL